MDAIPEGSPIKVTAADALAALDHLDVVSWTNLVLGEDYDGLGVFSSSLNGANGDGSGPGSASRLPELDRRLTTLVGALDIAAEETSGALERALEDLARTAPRLTYDLHFAREGAHTLDTALSGVRVQASAAEGSERTGAALSQLSRLDGIKTNMSAAREVLHEAERWGSLEGDVGALLSGHKYEAAAARLAEAGASMDLFSNTPEFDARRSLMISLQNQLEAALSAALVAAIESRDAEVCRAYFAIFANIQREAEFRTYYYGARRTAVVQMWQDAVLSDCDPSSTIDSVPPSTTHGTQTQTLAVFLPTFYSALLPMLQNERASITAIFPDPQATMTSLLASTMAALQPSLSQRLSTASAYHDNHGNTALLSLISALKATEEFAVGVDKLMQKIDISAPTADDSPTTATTNTSKNKDSKDPNTAEDTGDSKDRVLARRQSSRKSVSRRSMHRQSISGANFFATMSISMASEWERALFEPFLDFQADYASLELRLLDAAVREALASDTRTRPKRGDRGHDHTIDHARALRERMVDVLSALEDAVGRCGAFTHGYGAAGLVRAVDGALAGFLDLSREAMITSMSSSNSKTRAGRSRGNLLPQAQQADLLDLDYSPDDWAAIQSGLHVLGAARALHDKIGGLEQALLIALRGFAGIVHAARLDPGGAHIAGTTKGELELLAQSTLNSAELVALLAFAEDKEKETTAQGRPAFLSPTLIPPPSPSPRLSGAGTGSGSGSMLGSASAPSLSKTLVQARAALGEYARAAQTALHDTLLGPLRTHLASYPTLPIWLEGAGQNGPSTAAPVPTFSLSPSAPAQRVADGLLNLPRLFEAYADDDALAFSLGTLPFMDEGLLRALSGVGEPVVDEGISTQGQGGQSHGHARRTSISMRTPPVPVSASPEPMLMPAAPTLTPEAVSSAWLCSLGRALVDHLASTSTNKSSGTGLGVLTRIGALGPGGAAQLAADAGYLGTIAQALNVEEAPLERWRRAAEMGEVEVRRALAAGSGMDGGRGRAGSGAGDGSAGGGRGGGGRGRGEEEHGDDAEGRDDKEDREVLRRVARMRGWTN
jgi:hypothetical protein